MDGPFRRLAADLWELERPVRLPGLHLEHRMTLVRLSSGELWIHSPVKFEERIAEALMTLGVVGSFIAPSLYHDLYWSDWFQQFPQAAFYCVPGMHEEHPELPFQHVLSPQAHRSWETEVPKLLLRGMPK